ncbi:ROK family protein [Streptomyces sp. 8L]|uniref:ROK family protein n=1 Tax=Streptomyces sp. 8L TaxID=2877242 RepID=UPI001CD76483|nr:ROK family transcriptional regulator [Streptomyces sp. 8L]MCA1221292.1 ROK family transcriptional regulator [Streptomyces sp. 8L]
MTANEANRVRVLQLLYDVGPLSRADLAKLTGVTRTTIGSIVQPMIDNGVLVEGAPRSSGAVGGKPARPLWFSRDGQPIGAVHLMPGRVQAAAVSPVGEVLATSSGVFRAEAANGSAAVDLVVDCLRRVLPPGGRRPLGVGVAIGGMVDTDSGTIVEASLAPALSGLPLAPLVSRRLGLPVHIDHHPRAQALGDRWFGQARGVRSFASLYLADVLGVGLVLDGVVQRGRSGAGGEIGHSVVALDGDVCNCGRRGCWETVATGRWLRREAARRGLPGADGMTPGRLTALVGEGRPAAGELLDRYARNIAVGIVNLQHALAPGLFLLHGDVVAGGEALREAIERHVTAGVLPHPGGPPDIRFARDDDHATLLGAAGIVLSQSLGLVH